MLDDLVADWPCHKKRDSSSEGKENLTVSSHMSVSDILDYRGTSENRQPSPSIGLHPEAFPERKPVCEAGTLGWKGGERSPSLIVIIPQSQTEKTAVLDIGHVWNQMGTQAI